MLFASSYFRDSIGKNISWGYKFVIFLYTCISNWINTYYFAVSLSFIFYFNILFKIFVRQECLKRSISIIPYILISSESFWANLNLYLYCTGEIISTLFYFSDNLRPRNLPESTCVDLNVIKSPILVIHLYPRISRNLYEKV